MYKANAFPKQIKLPKKAKDLTGQRFNRLVAKYPVGKNKAGNIKWFCKCDCGKTVVAAGGSLMTGQMPSCGCRRRELRTKGFNKHAIENGIVKLELEDMKGRVKAIAIIDEADLDVAREHRWYATQNNYVETTTLVKHRKTNIRLHRILAGKHFKEELSKNPKLLIDHINQNPLDNRMCNLRLATHSTNKMNRGKPANNTSGYKGVSWDKVNKKWHARIKVGKLYLSLGRYLDKDDAARAYNEAAEKYFGEFACLNVILDDE